jgi:hypothetical protein
MHRINDLTIAHFRVLVDREHGLPPLSPQTFPQGVQGQLVDGRPLGLGIGLKLYIQIAGNIQSRHNSIIDRSVTGVSMTPSDR